jgi:hypothetical protein
MNTSLEFDQSTPRLARFNFAELQSRPFFPADWVTITYVFDFPVENPYLELFL